MHPTYNYIKQSLGGLYSEGEASAIAKWIATEVLDMTTVELYAGKDNKISQEKLDALEVILSRLKANEPIQYILGRTPFCGMLFRVAPGVLIPRPETEELVEWVVSENSGRTNLSVLDIGTGSGCIAVALASKLQGAEVSAWDISCEALNLASGNAEANGVTVSFSHVDVLGSSVPLGKVDVIVSNPPYITISEKELMDANVTDWEPELALFVPDDDPLLFYRRIAEVGKEMLNPGGGIYFEINQAFGTEMVEMMHSLGYSEIELRKDLFDNERMVRGRLK